MTKKSGYLVGLIIALVGVICLAGFVYLFETDDLFRAQFIAGDPPVMTESTEAGRAATAQRNEFVGKVSFGIFLGLFVLQFAAIISSHFVINNISCKNISGEDKLKQLENADLFFDLPLYIGLFGTVSSFMIMTFSPGSFLIAYSSTLVGILFSIVLKLLLLYPVKSRLLAGAEAAEVKKQ